MTDADGRLPAAAADDNNDADDVAAVITTLESAVVATLAVVVVADEITGCAVVTTPAAVQLVVSVPGSFTQTTHTQILSASSASSKKIMRQLGMLNKHRLID